MKRKNFSLLLGGIAIVVVAVAIALVATHDNKSKDTTTGMSMNMSGSNSSAVATTKVAITNYEFAPMVIKVKVGSTVTWTNQDSVHHTVTVDNGAGPNSPLFGQNQTYSYAFKKAGTYTYHCAVHPEMHGTVVVTN